MQRRILFAAFFASSVFAGCGSDGGGAPRGTAAGAGGSGGSQAIAGAATQGGSSAAGSATTAGGTANGGMTVGGSAGASAGGTATTAGTGGTVGGSGGSGGSGGAPPKQAGTPLIYIGGFGDYPIRTYALDKTSGALTQKGGDESGGSSPSYLTAHPTGPYLYNANEDDGSSAGVTAHHVKADGTLEPLNHQKGSDSSCNGNCGFTHVAVAPNGKWLMAASYDGGSVSLFPINQDGSLGAEKQMLDFGNDAEAHSTSFDPSGKFAWVPTLGLDKVQQLKLSADGALSANSPANVASGNKAGPRHMAVHPNGKLAFVINETASTMTPYAVSADGQLAPGMTVSTLPQGASGETYGQHVELSPDGRFLYGSNVGHDSIVVFSVDQASGALTWLQDQPSGGKWPRDFDMDPNGEVIVVANRDSNNLAVFKIGADGKLSPLGQPKTVPDQPTSVVIRYQP